MNLVTVTCKMDVNDMIRQCKSIDRFCKGIKHYVIVNDDTVDLDMWRNLLTPHYKNNSLQLLELNWKKYTNLNTRIKFLLGEYNKGYHLQQLFKLIVSKIIKDDYLVLDSKYFFIKEPDYTYWYTLECNNKVIHSSEVDQYKALTLKKYYNRLGIEVPQYIYNNLTPFLISYNVIKHISDSDIKWFNNQENLYEYLFYSAYILKDKKVFPKKQSRLKDVIYYNSNGVDTDFIHDTDDVEIVCVHRDFINTMTNLTRKNLNKFLYKLKISTVDY